MYSSIIELYIHICVGPTPVGSLVQEIHSNGLKNLQCYTLMGLIESTCPF